MHLAMPTLAFALSILFIPGIAGAATTPRWALMSITIPFVASLCRPKVTFGHVWLVAFVAWSLLTLAWTSNFYDGVFALWQLLLLAGLFWIGSTLGSVREVFIGAGIGFGVNSAIVIVQYLGFSPLPTALGIVGMGATFINPNYLAQPAAIVLVGLLVYELWWFVPFVIPSIVIPESRSAIIGLCATGSVWLWGKHRLAAILTTIICLVVLAGTHFLVYHYTGDAQRLAIWYDTASNLSVLGQGLGSFYTSFAGHATDIPLLTDRPDHAHGDLLEITYELGIPGLVLFTALCWYAIRSPHREGLILCAILAMAAADMPLRWPMSQFLFGLVAGYLCTGRRSVREFVLHRGGAICGWYHQGRFAIGPNRSEGISVE